MLRNKRSMKKSTNKKERNMKREMTNLREQKGITLVALVITIIIIIILATVAINFAFGDNGLIKRAEDARDYYTNSAEYEEQSMANLDAYLEGITAPTVVEAFKNGELQAGDYVNYVPDEHDPVIVGTDKTGYTDAEEISGGTDQTFTQDAENVSWRILGLSEDGEHLLLTTGSPIKKDGEDPYLILQGARGYLSCEATLDEICRLYHNDELAEDTRSMTAKDIENVLGGVTVTYPEEGSPNTGTVTLNADESNTNVGMTTPYRSYTYFAGDYTPEGAVADPIEHATAGTQAEGDAYMFEYDYDEYQSLGVDISREVYDMLFEGTTEEENYAKSYWLASPGVSADNGYAGFGPGAVDIGIVYSGGYNLFFSRGNWSAFGLAVRPVVVLKSNVNINQLQEIEKPTTTEDEGWTSAGGIYGSV